MRGWMLLALAGCAGGGAVPEPLSDCRTAEGDDVDYRGGASVVGDTLKVPVGFGGGCEAHTLVVCWPAQAFDDSDPPGVLLEVWHDANGDTCEAYLSEDVEVDLTPLRDGRATGTLDITVGAEAVTYTW